MSIQVSASEITFCNKKKKSKSTIIMSNKKNEKIQRSQEEELPYACIADVVNQVKL